MKAILSIVVLAIVCGVLPIVNSMPPSFWRLVGLRNRGIDDSSSDQDGDEVGDRKYYNNYDKDYENDDSDENVDYKNDENNGYKGEDDENDDSDENNDYKGDDYENDDSDENDDYKNDENNDYKGDDYENDDSDENDDYKGEDDDNDDSDENDDYKGDDYANDENDDDENDDSDENDDYKGDDYEGDANNENDDSESDENDDYTGDDYENDDDENDNSESDENDDDENDDYENDEDNENDDSESDDSESDENDDNNGTSIELGNDQGKLKQAELQIDYLLYTRQNSQSGDLLRPDALGELLINGSAHRGTIFIFHGFASNGYADWVQDMKDELLLFDNFNVIVVDWRKGARGPLTRYLRAARNTRIVGQRTANLIQAIYNERGIGAYTMHLIGHSLGAHCAGFTGKRIQELIGQRLSRISGLDPAGPRFANSEPGHRLDKNDAYYVDIIHTNDGKLGWKKNSPLGHVDFYPNGGSKQPGCPGGITDSCSHSRATELFIYSIMTCPFLTRPGAAVCPEGPDTELQMGYHSYIIIESDPALFCLETTGTAPYCDKISFSDVNKQSDSTENGRNVPSTSGQLNNTHLQSKKPEVVQHVKLDKPKSQISLSDVNKQSDSSENGRNVPSTSGQLNNTHLQSEKPQGFQHVILEIPKSQISFSDVNKQSDSTENGRNIPSTSGQLNNTHLQSEKPEVVQHVNLDKPKSQFICAAGPTVFPVVPFRPDRAARKLRKAVAGLGTDEAAIINVLTHHTYEQRIEIERRYKTIFNRGLRRDLRSDLSGTFEYAVLALFYSPREFDAKEIRRSLKGRDTDEATLIEILSSRRNAEILEDKLEYGRSYDRDMDNDIRADTSRDFEDLLISLSAAKRDDGPADPVQARLDAIALHEAGDERPGTDEAVFTGILSSRSYAQLNEISRKYKPLARRTLTQSIKRETNGNLEDGYLAIVNLATNTPAFFAEKLYRSMRGPGTDNKALIRLVVSRSEIDMKFIKEEFQRKYSRSLASAIKGDTSGHFEKLLLALIKGQKCKLKVE